MGVRRHGSWGRARASLSGGGARMRRAIDVAVLQEAHLLRREIVEGLRKGSKNFEPLSPLTLAARRLAGFRGSKALIRTGELRNSISVVKRPGKVFVGVPRKSGERLVRVAEIQEFGTQPFIIPITPKMRRYLAVLFKEAGIQRRGGGGGGAGVVVVQIPARPFLRSAWMRWQDGKPEKRIQKTVARAMGWR